jgi:hypothetical protein
MTRTTTEGTTVGDDEGDQARRQLQPAATLVLIGSPSLSVGLGLRTAL